MTYLARAATALLRLNKSSCRNGSRRLLEEWEEGHDRLGLLYRLRSLDRQELSLIRLARPRLGLRF